MKHSPLVTVLVALALAACGRSPSASRLGAGGEPEKILLAVMGGNTSCGSGSSPFGLSMFGPFDDLRKNLEASGDYAVDYFVSCHNSDPAVHFTASDVPGQVFTTDFAGAQAKIDRLFDAAADHRAILIGHSYGGWLAMKSAVELHENLAALVTIDPISRKTCTIFTPSGCTQAPTDITHDDRLEIKSRAARWLNFWQDKTFYLHASPIPEADENVKENAQHTEIDALGDVWTRLDRLVKSALRG